MGVRGPRTVNHDCQVIRRITSVMPRPIRGSATGKAECNDDRAGDHGQADVGVGAGMLAIRDQRRAGKRAPRTSPDLRRDQVAGVADPTGRD
jgi:hypothetical protein